MCLSGVSAERGTALLYIPWCGWTYSPLPPFFCRSSVSRSSCRGHSHLEGERPHTCGHVQRNEWTHGASPGLQRPPRSWQKLPEVDLRARKLPTLQPRLSGRDSGLHQTCEHIIVSAHHGEQSPGNLYMSPFRLIHISGVCKMHSHLF